MRSSSDEFGSDGLAISFPEQWKCEMDKIKAVG